jgi:hypothetical protein
MEKKHSNHAEASVRAGIEGDGTPSVNRFSPSEKPAPPIMEQVFTTDTTVEALATLLKQNPRGLIVIRDELSGWVRGMDQYKNGKGADRQMWLSSWSGAPIVVNRKNLTEPIFAPNPFICVVGCLPPDVLPDFSDERGREDGFIHRILFGFPPQFERQWSEASISPEVLEGYHLAWHALRRLAPDTDGNDEPHPKVVNFDDEAKMVFVAWIQDHYREMDSELFPEHLRGPWAKMPAYCARLVLVLHMIRFVCGEAKHETLDNVTVLRATVLTEYFKAHAKRVYARLHVTEDDKRVSAGLRWIRGHGNSATLREFVTYRVAGCKKRVDAEILFHEFEDRGYGRIEVVTPANGGKSVVFRLFSKSSNQQSAFDEKSNES